MPSPFVGFCNPFYARNIISRSKKSSIVHVLGKKIFSQFIIKILASNEENVDLQCVTIEFRQSPVYVVNWHFSTGLKCG